MNQKKFIQLVNPFKDKVYRVAKRLLISDDEAQDATQEVLLKLWTKRDHIKKYYSLEAFAMTMTKNYCYDKLKARGSNNLKIIHTNYEDRATNTNKLIDVADEVAWVYKIMQELPKQQRLIVHMRDIEHMDNAEVAAALAMNETAVRVALSRGRKKIREELIKKRNYGVT